MNVNLASIVSNCDRLSAGLSMPIVVLRCPHSATDVPTSHIFATLALYRNIPSLCLKDRSFSRLELLREVCQISGDMQTVVVRRSTNTFSNFGRREDTLMASVVIKILLIYLHCTQKGLHYVQINCCC